MNVKVSDVVSKFLSLSGINEQDRDKWVSLCEKSIRSIKASIREEISNPSDIARLEDACAALAFYNYILILGARETKSFSAGEISVTKNDNASKYAFELWADARASIANLICDKDFSFRAVKYR